MEKRFVSTLDTNYLKDERIRGKKEGRNRILGGLAKAALITGAAIGSVYVGLNAMGGRNENTEPLAPQGQIEQYVPVTSVSEPVKYEEQSERVSQNSIDSNKAPKKIETVSQPKYQEEILPNTRGVRNNNPGNLEDSSNQWDGQVGSDGRFCKFSTPEHGLRAMFKLVNNYGTRYNLDTIEEIIGRWAPNSENDTKGYIQFVANQTGYSKDEKIDTDLEKRKVVQAMCRKESGAKYDTKRLIKAQTMAKH